MTQHSKTIREMVDEKVALLRNAEQLSPQQLATESIELSSLWASINKEIVERKLAYNIVLRDALEMYETPPRAKIHAETTPEFREWQLAEAYSKGVQDLVRTTKKATTLATEELRESKY